MRSGRRSRTSEALLAAVAVAVVAAPSLARVEPPAARSVLSGRMTVQSVVLVGGSLVVVGVVAALFGTLLLAARTR
jgi:hypothetical protein